MTRIAFVFPGQGSQSVGMGQALAAASPAAAAVFAEADAALGEPISRLAFEGPAEELDLTENAQPALLATSIAYLARAARALGAPRHRARPSPRSAAGHSMGQYSALVAAGVVLAGRWRSGSSASAADLMQASGRGRTARWPRSSASTTAGCPSSSPRPAPRHLRRREPQLPGPGRRVGRARRPSRRRAEIAKELGARKRDRAAGVAWRPTPR